MEQNKAVFDFTLSPEEMARIQTLDLDRSAFYSHFDPEKVEWLNQVRYDI